MSTSSFAVPAGDRYFEDYVPGAVYDFGSISVTQDEILAFARQFDPQYFHVDPEAAARGPFRGIVASGWHTGSLAMRMYVDHYLAGPANLGSPGMEEVNFQRPVRPGDTLAIRISVLEASRSRSKPDRGAVRAWVDVLNQNHEIVMSMKVTSLFRCRGTAG